MGYTFMQVMQQILSIISLAVQSFFSMYIIPGVSVGSIILYGAFVYVIVTNFYNR